MLSISTIASPVFAVPGCFVGLHRVLRSLECFKPKLLYVRLTSHIIRDGIIFGVVGLGLILYQPNESSRFSSKLKIYLLELVHKIHGVVLAIIICLVEILCQNLLNSPVIAFMNIRSRTSWLHIYLTPICNYRFRLLQLSSSLREPSNVSRLQSWRNGCCHVGSIDMICES